VGANQVPVVPGPPVTDQTTLLARRCPAGKCRPLIHYRITERCIGCTICAQKCPAGAIAPRPLERHEIDDAKCIRCGTCKMVCPVGAVKVQ
jgi:ferredoxin